MTKEANPSSLKSAQEKQNVEESCHLSTQASVKLNSSRKNRHQRKTTHRYSVRDARKSQLSTSDSEGNSDEKTSVMMKHRRSQFLQPFLTNQPKEQYILGRGSCPEAEEVQNSSTKHIEDSKQIIPVQETSSETLSEPVALSASNHENSPFDLCHILLSLLEKICKFDTALNHKPALAANVISTLTELLSKLADCYSASCAAENEIVSSSWTEEPVALVQRMLFRTVLHLMAIDVTNAETMPGNLRKNLIDLLKAALKTKCFLEKRCDYFASKQRRPSKKGVQDDCVFSRFCHRALLLPECIEGILQILICCLQSAASNPLYFSQAMDLVHEFIQHQGFKLFECAVLQMEWLVSGNSEVNTEVSEYLRALINSIMKIISTIKKVKSEQLHQSVCTRKRHRRCEYSHFMHHHRDLSGLPVSAFKNQVSKNPFEETAGGEVHYPDRCCCIAVCAHQCLRLLQQASLGSTCFQLLSGVHNVGICCCMDPKSVIIPLLHSFKSKALKNFQPHILSVLNKFILDQLGGADGPQKLMQASCNICTIDCDQIAELDDVLQRNAADVVSSSSSSAPHRSQGILPSRGSEDMLLKWDALEAYQSLVFEEDDKLRCIQIASHVCSLIQKGNQVVQWKLYNYILNPVLQRGVELAHHSQQLGVAAALGQIGSCHRKCLPQEALQIYLQTLPSLFKSRLVDFSTLLCHNEMFIHFLPVFLMQVGRLA